MTTEPVAVPPTAFIWKKDTSPHTTCECYELVLVSPPSRYAQRRFGAVAVRSPNYVDAYTFSGAFCCTHNGAYRTFTGPSALFDAKRFCESSAFENTLEAYSNARDLCVAFGLIPPDEGAPNV